MTSEEFMGLVYSPHIGLYFCVLLVVVCLYCIVLKKIIHSIIDPSLFATLNLAFAAAVPIFLYYAGFCPDKHIIYFATSQMILVGVFLLVTRNINYNQLLMNTVNHEYDKNRFFFNICLVIYLFTTLYSWLINGIPIFNENRFEINTDNSSGILGLLGRFSDACRLFCTLYIFYLNFHGRKKYSSILMLLLIAISMMSGSKGFIFSFVKAYFFYSVFYAGKMPKVKKKYILPIAAMPLCVILLAGYANGGLSSVLYFGYRLLANGDTYWNAYPYSVIDNIKVGMPFLNITSIFWGPFRHIFGFDVDKSLFETVGALLFEYNYRVYPDGGAPNSQLSVVSYAFYKWGGLLMTAIMALIGSRLYCMGYKRAPQNIYVCCKRALLVMMGLAVFGDIYLFFNGLFNYLLFVGLYKSSNVLYPLIYSEKNNGKSFNCNSGL